MLYFPTFACKKQVTQLDQGVAGKTQRMLTAQLLSWFQRELKYPPPPNTVPKDSHVVIVKMEGQLP